jgi:hypothetical protein
MAVESGTPSVYSIGLRDVKKEIPDIPLVLK